MLCMLKLTTLQQADLLYRTQDIIDNVEKFHDITENLSDHAFNVSDEVYQKSRFGTMYNSDSRPKPMR